MAHCNGEIEWTDPKYAPLDVVVYGFFEPYRPDDGYAVHIRAVQRKQNSFNGHQYWADARDGREISTPPVLFTERLPYPKKSLVMEVEQRRLDEEHARQYLHLSMTDEDRKNIPPAVRAVYPSY